MVRATSMTLVLSPALCVRAFHAPTLDPSAAGCAAPGAATTSAPAAPFDPSAINVLCIEMEQYLDAGGPSAVEQRGRMAAYVQALELQLEVFARGLRGRMEKAPGLLQVFDQSHADFLLFVESQARLAAETACWNLATGERDDATTRGYVYLDTKARLVWKQIRSYGLVELTQDVKHLQDSKMVKSDTRTTVGGYLLTVADR